MPLGSKEVKEIKSLETQVLEYLLTFKNDPLNFIRVAFPFGVRNTPLHKFKGLRKWQEIELLRIGKLMVSNAEKYARGETIDTIRVAVCSGRGNGKSALIAMLSVWSMTCWVGSTTVITANTETQLRTKTFPEIAKWFRMAIHSNRFEINALSIKPSKSFRKALEIQLKLDCAYYYTQAITSSKDNPDAFAGIHNQKGVFIVFDEASGIPDNIFNVSKGFFTDDSPFKLWVVMSNGRRNTGSFYECFHKNREHWHTSNIDIRDVEGLDTDFADLLIAEYGLESDVVKTEVLGQFPSQSNSQFISRDVVTRAMDRNILDTYKEYKDDGLDGALINSIEAPLESVLEPQGVLPILGEVGLSKDGLNSQYESLILGVDIARYGADKTVLFYRRGRDGTVVGIESYQGLSVPQVATKIKESMRTNQPDAVFLDASGVGGGVFDILHAEGYGVTGIDFGSRPDLPNRFLNKRAEMWSNMRDWLHTGCLDRSPDLLKELTNVEYGFKLSGQLVLQSKAEIKRSGLSSPDIADAIALTFAKKLMRRSSRTLTKAIDNTLAEIF